VGKRLAIICWLVAAGALLSGCGGWKCRDWPWNTPAGPASTCWSPARSWSSFLLALNHCIVTAGLDV